VGNDPFAKAVDLFWRGSISGPAAVLCFFVISGFCIHYPYAQGKAFDLREYVIRRFVRVVLPMVAALFLWRLFHGWDDFHKDWLGGIPAWSIVAELIYYALYPFLRRIPKINWKLLTGITFLLGLAFALATQKHSNINYPAWGYSLDWVLGLPVWLLGICLAESPLRLPSPSSKRIWIGRGIAVLLGAITTWLAWQRLAGHHLTLNFVALYIVYWIRDELGYARHHAPVSLWEWGGTWSYSLYLTHGLAFAVFRELSLPNFGHGVNWLLKMSVVIGIALVFFYAFERPSHRLAQALASRYKKASPAPAEDASTRNSNTSSA
jgi:peptidoglycan/LPS O-acetylase OafA/YrhL